METKNLKIRPVLTDKVILQNRGYLAQLITFRSRTYARFLASDVKRTGITASYRPAEDVVNALFYIFAVDSSKGYPELYRAGRYTFTNDDHLVTTIGELQNVIKLTSNEEPADRVVRLALEALQRAGFIHRTRGQVLTPEGLAGRSFIELKGFNMVKNLKNNAYLARLLCDNELREFVDDRSNMPHGTGQTCRMDTACLTVSEGEREISNRSNMPPSLIGSGLVVVDAEVEQLKIDDKLEVGGLAGLEVGGLVSGGCGAAAPIKGPTAPFCVQDSAGLSASAPTASQFNNEQDGKVSFLMDSKTLEVVEFLKTECCFFDRELKYRVVQGDLTASQAQTVIRLVGAGKLTLRLLRDYLDAINKSGIANSAIEDEKGLPLDHHWWLWISFEDFCAKLPSVRKLLQQAQARLILKGFDAQEVDHTKKSFIAVNALMREAIQLLDGNRSEANLLEKLVPSETVDCDQALGLLLATFMVNAPAAVKEAARHKHSGKVRYHLLKHPTAYFGCIEYGRYDWQKMLGEHDEQPFYDAMTKLYIQQQGTKDTATRKLGKADR